MKPELKQALRAYFSCDEKILKSLPEELAQEAEEFLAKKNPLVRLVLNMDAKQLASLHEAAIHGKKYRGDIAAEEKELNND